ncbi:hypothetical protein BDZ89DRAFT_1034668 [Hymenopellis radicata]|nr:hypothetical protein BDZ89DRAFT_1034668 [Hymenopellis radicata]
MSVLACLLPPSFLTPSLQARSLSTPMHPPRILDEHAACAQGSTKLGTTRSHSKRLDDDFSASVDIGTGAGASNDYTTPGVPNTHASAEDIGRRNMDDDGTRERRRRRVTRVLVPTEPKNGPQRLRTVWTTPGLRRVPSTTTMRFSRARTWHHQTMKYSRDATNESADGVTHEYRLLISSFVAAAAAMTAPWALLGHRRYTMVDYKPAGTRVITIEAMLDGEHDGAKETMTRYDVKSRVSGMSWFAVNSSRVAFSGAVGV